MKHTTISCAAKGCYAIITLHPDDERQLRKTKENFYCPAGHGNYFAGTSDEQKEIARLERTVKKWVRNYSIAIEERDDMQRAVQVCPFDCGWHGRRILQHGRGSISGFLERASRDLANHLVAKHNATREPVALLLPGNPTKDTVTDE